MFVFEEVEENESGEKDVWIADGASSGLYSLKQIHFSQVYTPCFICFISGHCVFSHFLGVLCPIRL